VTDYARRLAAAREARGVGFAEAAAALDISFPAYVDLERYDDEIVTALSFRQVVVLSELLALDLRKFFGGSERHRTFDELADQLRARLADRSLADLEDEIGWELGAQLESPALFADYPLDALADIAGAVDADWRDFLPANRDRRAP